MGHQDSPTKERHKAKILYISSALWLLFFSSYLLRSRVLGGHILSNISSYSLIALTVLFLFSGFTKFQAPKLKKADWVIVLFLTFALFSTIFSVNPSYSSKYLIKYAFLYALNYLIVTSLLAKLDTEKQLHLLLLGILPTTLNPWTLKVTVGNITGIFPNKNTFGTFAMLVSTLSAVLTIDALQKKQKRTLIFLAIFIASSALLLLSGCRAAVLTFLITLVIILTYLSKKHIKTALVSLIIVSTTSIFVLAAYPQARHRLSSILHISKDSSARSRVLILKNSLKLAQTRLPFGWGYGKIVKYLCKSNKHKELIKKTFKGLTNDFCHGRSHNTLIELIFQGGVLGLLFGIVLYIYLLLIIAKGFKKKADLTTLAPAILLLALLINGLAEIAFISKRGLILFTLLALCRRSEEKLEQ